MSPRILIALAAVSAALGLVFMLAVLETRPREAGPVLNLREINDTIAEVTAYVRQHAPGVSG